MQWSSCLNECFGHFTPVQQRAVFIHSTVYRSTIRASSAVKERRMSRKLNRGSIFLLPPLPQVEAGPNSPAPVSPSRGSSPLQPLNLKEPHVRVIPNGRVHVPTETGQDQSQQHSLSVGPGAACKASCFINIHEQVNFMKALMNISAGAFLAARGVSVHNPKLCILQYQSIKNNL